MSDFDKRLSQMMNEDEHSPNMQNNWEKLKPRLQPPQPLQTAWVSKRWLIGIAASVSLLVVSAMTYYLVEAKKENNALKNEVTVLKKQEQGVDNQTNTNKENILPENKNDLNKSKTLPPTDANKSVENGSAVAQKDLAKSAIDGKKTIVENKNQNTVSENKASNAAVDILNNNNKKQTRGNSGTPKKDQPKQIMGQSPAPNIASTPSVLKAENGKLSEKPAAQPNAAVEKSADKNPLNAAVNKNVSQESNKAITNANTQKEAAVVGAELNNSVPSTIINKAGLTILPLATTLKPTFSTTPLAPLSMASVSMPQSTVLRPLARTRKWAVGVQAFTSLGDGDGKKDANLIGWGIVASYNLTRNFELMATAEAGEMRYDFKGRPKAQQIPKTPPAPSMHDELRRVSGNQSRQQLSIGLKYKIPTNTILTPSFNLGYDWQRLGQQSCRFDFRNQTTGGELAVNEISPTQISNNLWHVGAGLEANISSFILGISASYQKDFSDNNDNRVILRGGLKYRF